MKFLFLIGLLLTALVAVTRADDEKKKEEKEDEKEVIVSYDVILQGTYSGKKDTAAVIIQTQQEWETLWKEHVSVLVPQPPVPSVDFESRVVAAIYAGEKRTGGYSVVIKDVVFEGDDIVVKYRLTEPQPNSFTLQVISQPFALLKIEKPKGTVRLTQE